jgi:hypothetical protein
MTYSELSAHCLKLLERFVANSHLAASAPMIDFHHQPE